MSHFRIAFTVPSKHLGSVAELADEYGTDLNIEQLQDSPIEPVDVSTNIATTVSGRQTRTNLMRHNSVLALKSGGRIPRRGKVLACYHVLKDKFNGNVFTRGEALGLIFDDLCYEQAAASSFLSQLVYNYEVIGIMKKA